ncbi:bifunctional phosphopantothenoylcysteine decarboxylase/phosphopantothenate--cysteine ligase CoaBC [Chitinophaga sp. SYP-B3965]|uniref:bifunctional phosphopantothenoylcysteine decarboxylase/phosphopantothenate--cysteine ligase CoaBC n=1 Tax=Chitinophaga sp. SYP-B3965 TaxID=2663120 RepID=UPI001299E092|nr:bifunctional phosphopantothenoylcysteine decarboxylase/phosphopantothenate--cysteine ligase CoaBC [Chitinophaga sp. SYP-B3965]MRG48110.1 bifunctional phosphopantothenoylcysteine decarboxylase/phosphopantothenate--cysteine ligase CoaBC [Chitinophaga sp. SYP-B3965]
MLQGKKILLGVSGSIAAYKAALLVRLLVKEGAQVKVLMTPAATEFITPLTLSTLSKQEVGVTISEHGSWSNHVMLGRWADVMLIAPASANTMAKMANGITDNLLLAVYLSATCPVLFAPAMDEDMWLHPATRTNVAKLLSYGHLQIPIEKGELASGLFGEGRMAEPEAMVTYLQNFFKDRAQQRPLAGKTALVSAGPTQEPLDPVRFISNHSSGKMGIALAEALAEAGASVQLVLGPTHLSTQHSGVTTTRVVTAADMFSSCLELSPKADIIVMAAAVADYRPKTVADKKMKKKDDELSIELEKTKDIARTLGSQKKNGQLLIGFSLETNNEREYAQKKLQDKNLDMVVLNSLNDAGAGFNYDTNKVLLLSRDGKEQALPLQSKQEVARNIVLAIIDLQHA